MAWTYTFHLLLDGCLEAVLVAAVEDGLDVALLLEEVHYEYSIGGNSLRVSIMPSYGLRIWMYLRYSR